MFINNLSAFRDFSYYSELRSHRNSDRRVVLLNGNMTTNQSSSMAGFSARIYKDGIYGFASAPEYDDAAIKNILRAAEDNAIFLSSREKTRKPCFPQIKPVEQPLNYTREDNITQKQIVEFISEIDNYIAKKYPSLASRYVAASCLNSEKMLKTSDGVFSHSFVPRSLIYVSLTAIDKEGSPIDLFEPFGGFGLFDDEFKAPSDLFDEIDILYSQVMEKCEGLYANAGQKSCILHPSLAGILAHEAVGHTVEADFVQSGSVAGPNMGKQVASEMVNLVDFANKALGQPCKVPVFVDDEGTPAKDAVIIENGILKNFMHNKESAMKFGTEPLGNARAFTFSDEPLIRMRNTAILPGKDKIADMIASIDDGYYFVKTGNGQADATGEFMFGVDFGYEIKNGKIGKAIKSTTIAGVAFEVLKTVDMLSDDMVWSASGMCGKKQPIPVGMGGPAVKCEINVGGK